MILKPVISEKAIELTDENNTYAFIVPARATKHGIAEAVAARYGVKVEAVRTQIAKGKHKQMPVQRGRQLIKGKRNDAKKAYVTLAEGESITLFEGSE